MFSLNYLKGKMPLWRAFWLYGVLIPTLYAVSVIAVFAAVTYIQRHYFGFDWTLIKRFSLVTTMVGTLIYLFGILAIWQCAGNCQYIMLTRLAAISILVGLALMVTKWVWVIHPIKGGIATQAVFVAYCWALLVLATVMGMWLYRGARSSGWLKQRLVPAILVLLVGLQLAQHLFFTPPPAMVIMGENGVINVGHVFDYQAKLKRVDASMAKSAAQLEMRAEQGDANAAYELGGMLMSEDYSGVNYTEAVRWLQYAMDHGVVFAKNELAILYQEGKGVDKDKKKAQKLYQEGADAGDDTAAYNLGLMYETGDGVPGNYRLAVKYYKRVVARMSNNPNGGCAENDLGALYVEGKGVPVDEVEARSLFEEAARKNFSIKLPATETAPHLPADFDFPGVYAAYRLATLKHQPLKDTALSGDDIQVAQAVADYYVKKCRS